MLSFLLNAFVPFILGAITEAIDTVGAHSHRSSLFVSAVGGASRQSVFVSAEELEAFAVVLGSRSMLSLHSGALYRCEVKRTGLTSVWDQQIRPVAVDVPLTFLVARLPFCALQELSHIHNVDVQRGQHSLDGLCSAWKLIDVRCHVPVHCPCSTFLVMGFTTLV